jgi:hypothetical protein
MDLSNHFNILFDDPDPNSIYFPYRALFTSRRQWNVRFGRDQLSWVRNSGNLMLSDYSDYYDFRASFPVGP